MTRQDIAEPRQVRDRHRRRARRRRRPAQRQHRDRGRARLAVTPTAARSTSRSRGRATAGATWHHKPVPGITKAAGGTWDRASDPVVAFGPDGTAYLSVLVISVQLPDRGRRAALDRRRPDVEQAVLRAQAHDAATTPTTRTGSSSTRTGRARTSAGSTSSGRRSSRTATTSSATPQAVRWSDDHGPTWSTTSLPDRQTTARRTRSR